MVNMPRVPGARAGWCSRLGGGGDANKQMSTMLNVAVGYFSSLLGTLGALWGGKLNIWEGIICCQPIWDVFAPHCGRGRAGERLTMGDQKSIFQIRQAVSGGLARARNCCWARWARFSHQKNMYISSYNVFTPIPAFSRSQGRQEWVVIF